MERGLFGLYFYPPESLLVEKTFAYEDYNVYSMRLAYDHSTAEASLTIRDTYGVEWDSIWAAGPGADFDRVYVGIENHAHYDAKWLDNTAMWLLAASGLPERSDDRVQGLELATPYPNPSSDRILISYRTPVAGDVSVTIFDTLGRDVMAWQRSGVAPGYHEVRWDATTYDGRRVAPGVYQCTVRAGADVRTCKMVVAR
jgi:hypothetical protein